ncbi:MAG: hypothetical protein F4242_10380, partial [Acidimicrobiales bacterium]|nr:hypothetical protein [Acidimicrobiales bacterium]
MLTVGKTVNFRFRHLNDYSGTFVFVRRGLRILVLFLISFSTVSASRAHVQQMQLSIDSDRGGLRNSVIGTFEESDHDQSWWNVELEGVDLLLIPDLYPHDVASLTYGALTGPVLNPGISDLSNEAVEQIKLDGQVVNRRGMVGRARNSIPVPERNLEVYELSQYAQFLSDVTLATTVDRGTKRTVHPATLTVPVGNWNTIPPVTLTAEQDSDGTSDVANLIFPTSGSKTIPGQTVVTVVDGKILREFSHRFIGEGQWTTVSTPLVDGELSSGDVPFPITGNAILDPAALIFQAGGWKQAQQYSLTTRLDHGDKREMLDFTTVGRGTDDLAYLDVEEQVRTDPPVHLSSDLNTIRIRFDTGKPNDSHVRITEGGASGTFKIWVEGNYQGDLTLNLVEVEDEEEIVVSRLGWGDFITIEPSSVTFTQGNWLKRKTVKVTAVQNERVRFGDEPYNEVGTFIGVDEKWVGEAYDDTEFRYSELCVIVTDDDVPSFEIVPQKVDIYAGESFDFEVRLNKRPLGKKNDESTAEVDVDMTRSGLSVAVGYNPDFLRFTHDNYNDFQKFTVYTSQKWGSSGRIKVYSTERNKDWNGYRGVEGYLELNIRGESDINAINVFPGNIKLNEGGEETFYVSLSKEPSGDVTVTIPPSNTDLSFNSNSNSPTSLTFTPSGDKTWSKSQLVTVTAAEDPDALDDIETITLTATGGGYDNVKKELTITVDDDEEAGLIVSSTIRVPEGETKTFTVRLAAEPSETVTVTIPPFDTDSDLSHNSPTLTFTPSGDKIWNKDQLVTVTAAEDPDAKDDTETITLTASGGQYIGQKKEVTVTVDDSEEARLVVNPIWIDELDEGADSSFTVQLSAQPLEQVTVTISAFTVQGLSHDKESTWLTFTSSDYDTKQEVVVSAEHDHNAMKETGTIKLTAAGGEFEGAEEYVTVVTSDDDEAGLIHANLDVVSVDEGGKKTFSVWLSVKPTETVTVTIPEFNNDGLERNESRLEFTPETYRVPRYVEVSAKQDNNAVDEEEIITLTASGGQYTDVEKGITIKVDDDDEASVIVSPMMIEVDENKSEVFTVRLSAEPTETVTVTIPALTEPDLSHDRPT